jgi:hypothetical protein
VFVLKADPWLPDYGMGFDVSFDEAPAEIDTCVESEDWRTPRVPARGGAKQLVQFVDGVRRVELRVVADLDGQRAIGLVGTYAVGTVRCDGRASFGEFHLGRKIVLGCGLMPPPLQIACGRSHLTFDPASEPGGDPDGPLLRLQTLMRDDESRLAAMAADESDGLVLCDGPIGFLELKRSPVVGVIKRFSRLYLDPEREGLLALLQPGQRTPLFGIADVAGRTRLYAWYLRLAPLRPEWHDHAGLVRCEVSSALGITDAIRIANQVTAVLPDYAGRPSDPRAPQNLAPIAGLETWLRHHMGDSQLVRRALLAHLSASARATAIDTEVSA